MYTGHRHALLRLTGEQWRRVEVVRRSPRSGGWGCCRAADQSAVASGTPPSALMVTTAPVDVPERRSTRPPMGRSVADRRRSGGPRIGSRPTTRRTGTDDLGASSTRSRTVATSSGREPRGDHRGDHEYTRHDHHHGDRQPGAEPPAVGRLTAGAHGPRGGSLEPVADAAHGGDSPHDRRPSCAPPRCARRRCVRHRTSRNPTPRRGSVAWRAPETGTFGEELQELELLGGELHRRIVNQHLASPDVDRHRRPPAPPPEVASRRRAEAPPSPAATSSAGENGLVT